MKIAIVGAGIGGLTAALCLLKEGHQVNVYEQASELTTLGAGLQLGASAVKVLAWLGLEQQLETVAVKPAALEFRLFSDGRRLLNHSLGEDYKQSYGAPYYHIHRADLQKILVNELLTIAPKSLHLNSKVEGYRELTQCVELGFSSGEQVKADCLIAADGIKSKIRQQKAYPDGTAEPRWSGYSAWRGMIPTEQLPEGFMSTQVTNYVGPGKHMVMYYVRNGEYLNFVGVVPQKEPTLQTVESWSEQASWEQLKCDFLGWHSLVETVVNAMQHQPCYRWNLYDYPSQHRWSSQRVALLGDAAHAALPFMAAGAVMAIEDARILSRVLSDNDITDSLQRYELNRLGRTSKVQKLSRQIAHLYHLPNSLALRLAFSVIAKRPKPPYEWLANYDPNTAILQ